MLRLGGPWWPMVAHGGQETPDTPEAMKTVPGLELLDIPKALRCIFNRNVRLSIMIGSRMVQKLWSTLVISSIVCSVRSSLGCCEASVYDHKVFWGIRMAFGFFPFVMMYPQLVSPQFSVAYSSTFSIFCLPNKLASSPYFNQVAHDHGLIT